jgi:hypothetical protein
MEGTANRINAKSREPEIAQEKLSGADVLKRTKYSLHRANIADERRIDKCRTGQ